MSVESQYLDLLKRVLVSSFAGDTGQPIEIDNAFRRQPKRFLVGALTRSLSVFGLEAVQKVSPEQLTAGRAVPRSALTMVGLKRLNSLQAAVEDVVRRGVPGDFIETGVWRGGASILMRAVLATLSVSDRKVWLADSFAGLPPPDAAMYPEDAGDRLHRADFLAVSEDQVRENFRSFGLLDEQVVFVPGWFRDTLPKVPIDKLSILRLDGDMYESTIVALENLYPKLSVGGHCIIDDYALPACRKAVEDYRSAQGIDRPLEHIDWTGAYWIKE